MNITEIKKALSIASHRTNLDIEDGFMDKIINDIKLLFPHKKSEYIVEAIQNGGAGKYGISYKFTIQLVLYWINSKIKEDFNKNREML